MKRQADTKADGSTGKRGVRVDLSPPAIVDAFLDLLEERDACGLRELAARLGCSHANIYNHFGDWRALRWAALAEILRREAAVLEAPGAAGSPAYLELLARHVDFALAHPAWFRLVWFEPMESQPDPAHAAALARPALLARAAFVRDWPNAAARLPEAESLIHEAVHGALVLQLHGRSSHADPAACAQAIKDTAGRLLALLSG